MQNATQNSIKYQQELLVKVERNNRMVQRLSEKLSSYTYEPKCPQQFEKYYELNKSIQNYKKYQKQVMSKIRKHELDLSDANNKEVVNHLNRFKELERDFASYLRD
ncbi:MAG: hypothetical protein VX798_11655 [Bacteroidota bacterium]|uniref:Uncharacterized protein n=1 Tax=Flagellimonas profundi TaxID=2915620 RepID=A0ABS3FCZ5_9FLAO|nr:hypothetical protein [Allomuricauda profundi]MBO0341024.1 hypothetical protein [Allomuricauda profundi]MEC7771831.1 hypothetical protein [Bacteroidota bacterium]